MPDGRLRRWDVIFGAEISQQDVLGCQLKSVLDQPAPGGALFQRQRGQDGTRVVV